MTRKIFLLLLFLGQALFAQVQIKNPQHLAIPPDQAQIIFRTACRVVAEEFHAQYSQVRFPVILVLGDDNERYTADGRTGTYTIYLRVWNPGQFADSAMRLAVHRLVSPERRNRMLTAILSRANAISPISVMNLKRADPAKARITTQAIAAGSHLLP